MATIDILKYAPKDVALKIINDLPIKDVPNICGMEEYRDLCQKNSFNIAFLKRIVEYVNDNMVIFTFGDEEMEPPTISLKDLLDLQNYIGFQNNADFFSFLLSKDKFLPSRVTGLINSLQLYRNKLDKKIVYFKAEALENISTGVKKYTLFFE